MVVGRQVGDILRISLQQLKVILMYVYKEITDIKQCTIINVSVHTYIKIEVTVSWFTILFSVLVFPHPQ